ncbi:coiled-coil domain-containing protein 175 [Perognathus longimembris pacificus]|uniref:coiled-coil domain-containing protein 175 n=1 Tax=Perognathus longimembris pacificus TaxID=214514 RepID=UPI0020186367|nr:coiled-coil domain-containing protein 175 [Perognathus longimembris pacificus]
MSWNTTNSLVTELAKDVAVSTGVSLDLYTFPPTLGSSVAAAALEQLFAIEESLKSDYFKCNEEARTFLKDIAVAVKKLEEMRKNTIDLLEIESMEMSRLYFLLETVPAIFNREMEECVRDARKLNIAETKEIMRRIGNVDNEIVLLKKSIHDMNDINESLHERQEELAKQHQELVLKLNRTMEEKAKVGVFINETYKTINRRKDEVEFQKKCIEETKGIKEKQESQYLLIKEELATRFSEIKIKCDSKRKETYTRKKELDRLKTKIIEMNQTVADSTEAISDHNLEIARLQAAIKTWEEQIKNMKKACLTLEEKMNFFVKHKEKLEGTSTNEKGEYLKKIKELIPKIHKVQIENKDLREKMFTVSRQYKIFLNDEEKVFVQHRKIYEENQKQIAFIAEKENFLSQRKVDIKNMEEGLATLEDLSRASNEIYRKQIKILGDNLERESQRCVITQWKIACARRRHARWLAGVKVELKDIAQQIEEAELKRIDLLEETTQRQEEIEEFVAEIEKLTLELKEEEETFVLKEKKLIKGLNKYEELLVKEELIFKQKEEELMDSLPQLQVAEEEYTKKSRQLRETYEVLRAQKHEETLLKTNIYQFSKDIEKYLKNMEKMKAELKNSRQQESKKIKSHFECLKKLEIEIQANDDKANLLIAENKRIKEHLAYLQNEAEIYKKGKELLGQNYSDLSWHILAQHARYTDLWAEFQAAVSDLVRNGEDVLQGLTTLIRKLQERDESIENMSQWLAGNLEKLRFIIKKEPPEEPRK